MAEEPATVDLAGPRAAILFEGLAEADDADTHMSAAHLIGWRYEKGPMSTLRRANAS